MNNDQTELQSAELNNTIAVADSYIRRQYLSELHNAHVVPMNAKLLELPVGKNVRLFKLNSLAYSSEDDFAEKMSNIYSAVSEFSSNQVLILDSDGYGADLYMGVACNEPENLSLRFDVFKGSFSGNFPGGKISVLNVSGNEKLLNSIFQEKNISLSSVSALTSNDKENTAGIYGIEKLIGGMYGKPFTMLLIASSMSRSDIVMLRQNLESIYTQLSPYSGYSISLNNNESLSRNESLNLTKSESVTEGTSVTESTTFGTSENTSTSVPGSEEKETKQAWHQILATVGAIGAVSAGVGGLTAGGLLQGLFYSSGLSGAIGSAHTLISGAQAVKTETAGTGKSYSVGFSEAETRSVQKGFSSSKGVSEGVTEGTGQTVQMNYENRSVKGLLDVLDMQIKRLQQIECKGVFGCAAYFVAGDNATAAMAANMYRSFMKRGNNFGQETAVNVWSDRNKIEDICAYLKILNHPLFHFEKRIDYPIFNASTIVSADEMPMYASLPKKSVKGLPASPHAEFAREVISSNTAGRDDLKIGSIYHLGKTEPAAVYLPRESLRGHMFVAGTTGAGKSTFSYGLLSRLYNDGVKFMVIEPAKGEYHKVLGGLEGVNVYGTDPMMNTPLLRINPFSFPAGIHVNIHIERLLEIFNSCWPMYAAMPAVLKDAVETIYKKCGFNLLTGRASPDSRFPTFNDLLSVLPEIINKSEFSGEVKGNYIGSLATRIKSLTDGVYACIFTENEISSETLFDENAIINLSRLGSGETKSLIMGLLIMKLQEYRMSGGEMNVPLRHVTLLEEAHHLLRADTGPSAEGVNLRAMSLEMITNAIAEMRTYGDGFIIADQSPALLDPAVIRNTNTKVIFKLFENNDKQSVCKALSLTEDQTNELSRLECGAAIIYQSSWDDPVLAKIDYFDEKNYRPYEGEYSIPEIDSSRIYSQCLAIALKGLLKDGQTSSASRELCKDILSMADHADEDAKKFMPLIKQFVNDADFCISEENAYKYSDIIIDSGKMMKLCGDTSDVEKWHKRAEEYVLSRVSLSAGEVAQLIRICLEIRRKDSTEYYHLFYRYIGFTEKLSKIKKTLT